MFRRLTQFYDDSSTFPPFRVNDETDAPDTFDRMKTEFLEAGWKKIVGWRAAGSATWNRKHEPFEI